MPYALHDITKPDAATQNITQAMTSTRNNMNALRDACILGGGFPGFNFSKTGGTAEQPTQMLWKRSTEWVRAALTWGVAGGEAGNVTVAVYSYSANSGGLYDAIGTKTITYDAAANVVSTLWS